MRSSRRRDLSEISDPAERTGNDYWELVLLPARRDSGGNSGNSGGRCGGSDGDGGGGGGTE